MKKNVGVPQASILSLLLLLSFINVLSQNVQDSSKMAPFADKKRALTSGKISEIEEKLYYDLKKIEIVVRESNLSLKEEI